MYESLLDHDLEDETTVVADVAPDMDDKALDEDDETDGLVEADDTEAAEAIIPCESRPCIGLAPGANGSPLRRPSSVLPVPFP